MLSYIKKYPISLFIILTVIYLSFFKPPKTDLSEIPNLDKLVHICMYFGMSGMLWLGIFACTSPGRGTVVACLGRSVLLPRAVQRVCRIAARILYQLPWRRLAGFCSKFYRSIARKSGCLLCGASKNDETVIINILLLS